MHSDNSRQTIASFPFMPTFICTCISLAANERDISLQLHEHKKDVTLVHFDAAQKHRMIRRTLAIRRYSCNEESTNNPGTCCKTLRFILVRYVT